MLSLPAWLQTSRAASCATAVLGCRMQAGKRHYNLKDFKLHIDEMGNKCAVLENNHQKLLFFSLLSSARPSLSWPSVNVGTCC